MRQFAGFGTAEETNARFRYLLEHGQTGLSTAFDMPSLMGHDSDHPRSLGEVGREGVAIDTVADMERCSRDPARPGDRVDDDQRSGGDHARLLRGRRRAPGHPARAARRARSRPTSSRSTSRRRSGASPSIRRCGWSPTWSQWCAQQMPRWHPISISGYHIREAGSTAAQELAFTLKDGLTYVEHAVARGLDVDDFAPRLSFFFNAQIDFFEEIAKYRAARRIWARELRETFGAQQARVTADALPHADRGRLADRPAAAQQHRPHRDRGARRRARRHPVAAHELLRRGARAANRGGRTDRPAHAADHRRRDRRHEHDRPARRGLLRRGPDRPPRAPGYEYFRGSTSSAAWSRPSNAAFPSARSPTRPSICSGRSTPAAASSSASTPSPRATSTTTRDPAHRPGARGQADRAGQGFQRRAATPPLSRPPWQRSRRRPRPRRQPDASAGRGRAGAVTEGEIVHRAAVGLGQLPRTTDVLKRSRARRQHRCKRTLTPVLAGVFPAIEESTVSMSSARQRGASARWHCRWRCSSRSAAVAARAGHPKSSSSGVASAVAHHRRRVDVSPAAPPDREARAKAPDVPTPACGGHRNRRHELRARRQLARADRGLGGSSTRADAALVRPATRGAASALRDGRRGADRMAALGPAIAGAERRTVIAAFNGAFKLNTDSGGFESYGRVGSVTTRRAGLDRHLFGRHDGHRRPGSRASPRPQRRSIAVRQNLQLLISHGRAAADLGCLVCWGATLGGVGRRPGPRLGSPPMAV